MGKVVAWLIFIGVAVAASAIVFAIWDFDLRWRPHTITRDQAEIAQALDQSGWVSPHLTGPKLYVIAYRGCADCARLEAQLFPTLQAAGVDTRVIMIARPDSNGLAQSTPVERATVAELWTNRSWKLFQQWSLAQPEVWTAPGAPAADGDAARTAVVGAGRQLVETLTPELQHNGVRFAYPTLIWWTRGGRLRACACTSAETYRFVEVELTSPPR
jgi:hypothetical protein